MAHNLPATIANPVVRDYGKQSELSGVDPSQFQNRKGKKGWKLDDSMEANLLELVKTCYLRCVRAGNHTPLAQNVWDSSNKKDLADSLRDCAGNGNARGGLVFPALGGQDSPILKIALELLRAPESFGVKGVPLLRADVKIEDDGKDIQEIPTKD
jgi:hypothetical protein